MKNKGRNAEYVKPKLGVSSCLLGDSVRFNGGHKRHAYVSDVLEQYFELVPFCPEVAAGLGIPREPIRLVVRDGESVLVNTKGHDQDFTLAVRGQADAISDNLAALDGYILKKDSPSCGMERVRRYHENGMPLDSLGVGIFAARLSELYPNLPPEEEGRLNDPVLRENFLLRVYVHHRWRNDVAVNPTAAALVRFQAEHKYLFMAYSPEGQRALGRMVAQAGTCDIHELTDEYHTMFSGILNRRIKRGRHVNVLHHMMGYLKKTLDKADKGELLELFNSYERGEAPLIVPLTLLQHHFRRHPDPYIQNQHYLQPYPGELKLRNHV